MRRVGDEDFDALVDLVREKQAEAIAVEDDALSGADWMAAHAVRMRLAETVAHIKAAQDDLAHSVDTGDVPASIDVDPVAPQE